MGRIISEKEEGRERRLRKAYKKKVGERKGRKGEREGKRKKGEGRREEKIEGRGN